MHSQSKLTQINITLLKNLLQVNGRLKHTSITEINHPIILSGIHHMSLPHHKPDHQRHS